MEHIINVHINDIVINESQKHVPVTGVVFVVAARALACVVNEIVINHGTPLIETTL